MTEETDRRPELSTAEVCEMFGIARATLHRWVKSGRIPEPAKDPRNGWPVWRQPELDAIAVQMRNKRNKA
jgi:predicted site-specific integrase-resolvase